MCQRDAWILAMGTLNLPASNSVPYSPHAHAAALARQGFFVFICDDNKEPRSELAPHAYLSATNDLDTINGWKVPFASTVAIACRQSRILVIDCDVKSGFDGVTAFHDFASHNGMDLSQFPCVATPSGGRHYYFSLPDGFTHGNGLGALPKGIDVRCAGYVISPGCILPDGREYRLMHGSLQSIPLLPIPLQNALKASKKATGKVPSATSKSAPLNRVEMLVSTAMEPTARELAYAAKVLADEKHNLATTSSGERNNQLFKSTAALANCIASNWLTHEEVEAAIWEACTHNGLVADDGAHKFHSTFNSGIRAGLSTPRPPLENSDNLGNIPTPIISAAKTHWHGETSLNVLRKELVKGMLPKTGVAIIAGQSGAGKTFVSLWLAGCVATGNPFFGHKIRENVGTLLLLGEGAGTIAERLEAIIKSGLSVNSAHLPIAWRSLNAPLMQNGQKEAIIQAIDEAKRVMRDKYGLRLGLIIVDTLAAAFSMNDENDAAEATRIMQFLLQISEETETLAIAVAHYGKSVETGVRGSSAYTASADVILAVQAKKTMKGQVESRHIYIDKSRVYGTGWACDFNLTSVPVGLDEDGETLWSCYVSPEELHMKHSAPQKKQQTLALCILMQSFNQMIGEVGELIYSSSNPNGIKAIRREMLRPEFYKHYPADGDTEEKRTDAKRKQFKRTTDTAIQEGRLKYESINGEDWLWLPA